MPLSCEARSCGCGDLPASSSVAQSCQDPPVVFAPRDRPRSHDHRRTPRFARATMPQLHDHSGGYSHQSYREAVSFFPVSWDLCPYRATWPHQGRFGVAARRQLKVSPHPADSDRKASSLYPDYTWSPCTRQWDSNRRWRDEYFHPAPWHRDYSWTYCLRCIL